jgi:hypothetical protein
MDDRYKENPLIEKTTRKVLKSIRDQVIENRKQILATTYLEILESYLIPRRIPTRRKSAEEKEEEGGTAFNLRVPRRRQEGEPDQADLERFYFH